MCDAFSYQQNVFNFQSYGIYEDMIGYIKIDAMNIEVPLYIGANEENLRKAAVVLKPRPVCPSAGRIPTV